MSNKIEYRKLTPEEKLYLTRLQSIVFSFNADEKNIREQIEKGEYNSENSYGAVDKSGQVYAGMEVIPFSMWFDGQTVPMYGIAGVASVPENRRQGNIRKVFEKVYEDIYEKGAVFSHLYPFMHDYYRKFGYEHVGSARKYTLPTAQARKFENNGSVHEYIKNESTENEDIRNKLIEVYDSYASRHNNMVNRSKENWNEVFNISLFGAIRFYYWKDADGNIKSWVKFEKNGGLVQINDIAWADNESMLGILQFIGMFEGSASKFSFVASPEFIAELYWNNLYDIEINAANWLGMNRIVNVKRALELMKKPAESGKFTIKVDDDFFAPNTNTYDVSFENEKTIVKIIKTASPDIELSQRALTQAVLGVYDLNQITVKKDVQINNNIKTLEKVFIKKNIMIANYF